MDSASGSPGDSTMGRPPEFEGSKGRARPHELVALGLALAEREGLDERDRRRLDREIGTRLTSPGNGTARSAIEWLRAWLEQAPSPALAARIDRCRRSLSLLRALAIGAGVFFGWAAAAALLQFEVHAGRINIVLCLGLLVLLPLLMLVFAMVGLLRSGAGNRSGGFDPEAGASREDAPCHGSWRNFALTRALAAALPPTVRQDAEILFGRAAASERLYGVVRRTQLFLWSQSFGLGFAVGAIVATLCFVVFTDLAFGWSTTLDVDAARVHRLVVLLAAPWSALWPEAVPSLDLVETTRHFRIAQGDPHVHFIDPIQYGAWWPFLVMSIGVYGLLPRLLVIGWGRRRLGRATYGAIAQTPHVERLLERLTSPHVETQAPEPEGAIGHGAKGLIPEVDLETWRARVGEDASAIVWAESIEDEALFERLGTRALRVRDAGGRKTLDEDAKVIADCTANGGAVLLCVRAYEPPLLEMLDFISDLRGGVGAKRGLFVVLLGGDAEDHRAWRQKLTTLGDPGLACLIPTAAIAAEGAE